MLTPTQKRREIGVPPTREDPSKTGQTQINPKVVDPTSRLFEREAKCLRVGNYSNLPTTRVGEPRSMKTSRFVVIGYLRYRSLDPRSILSANTWTALLNNLDPGSLREIVLPCLLFSLTEPKLPKPNRWWQGIPPKVLTNSN